MTDTVKEQLSALLDGELPDGETELLLKRLERDAELRRAMSRYSLIGAALRTEGTVPAARQVAARVSAAVAREPALVARRRVDFERLSRPLAGFAVAASVAALAVMLGAGPARVAAPVATLPDATLAALDDHQPVVLAPPAVSAVPVAVTLPSYTTPPATAGDNLGLSDARLANYIIAHADYAGPLAPRNLVSALVVSAPEQRPESAAGSGGVSGP
jgi:sigma-E factor negative regulatory protein RseA